MLCILPHFVLPLRSRAPVKSEGAISYRRLLSRGRRRSRSSKNNSSARHTFITFSIDRRNYYGPRKREFKRSPKKNVGNELNFM